jgi:phospholipid-binding lipoprotein MlaA
MLPILGPSTVRDTVGRIPDQFTYPVNYLEDDSTRYIIRGVDFLDLRAGLLDLDAQIEKSYDKYAFIRNAWLQRREYQVTDGNVGDVSSELEEGMDVDPANEAPPADSSPQTEAPTPPK